jgi:hypothetical protein
MLKQHTEHVENSPDRPVPVSSDVVCYCLPTGFTGNSVPVVCAACCARCRDVSWAMQLLGLRQVESAVARAASYRDEADVAPEWVLDVDAVTETQVGPCWPASKLHGMRKCSMCLEQGLNSRPCAAHAGHGAKVEPLHADHPHVLTLC